MATTTDCDNHAATFTARMHAVIGPWTYVSDPMQVCATCRAVVNRDGDLMIPEHFKTEEPARD